MGANKISTWEIYDDGLEASLTLIISTIVLLALNLLLRRRVN